jgi:hypothetical protein
MVDCVFREGEHLHMHIAEERDAATIVTSYTPGETGNHFEDLRKGVESKGRLVDPGNQRFSIEMFLLNDSFGQEPGEVLWIQVGRDGKARMEAKGSGGAIRVIDTGACVLPKAPLH